MTKLIKVRMPSISFVVARSEPGHVIGCENKLPWHLKSDLVNFRKITTNHVVIMGRKTFDSIGKPLPNRINVVLTTKMPNDLALSFSDKNLFFAENKDSALYFADLFSFLNGYRDIFVIGGGVVYDEFKDTFNKVYLTEVYGSQIQGDAYFDYNFDSKEWVLDSEDRFDASGTDQYPFSFKVLRKKELRGQSRSRALSSFLTLDENLEKWELEQLDKVKLPKTRDHNSRKSQLELPNIEQNIITG